MADGRIKRTGIDSPCEFCGKAVYSYPSRVKRFCSMACRDAKKKQERVNFADGTACCAKCQAWKPIADFVSGTGGRPHSYCKVCSSEWFHERRGTPVEERKPYAPMVKFDEETKKANKQAQEKAWRQANRGKVYLWNRLRRSRERAAGPGLNRQGFEAMKCHQDYKCMYCQASLESPCHIDHKLPVSRGGMNGVENLQLLCPTCNLRKGTMTHEEYASRIGWVDPRPRFDPRFDVEKFCDAMSGGDASAALALLRDAQAKRDNTGPRGIHGDKSVLRQEKLDEMDLLARTIERLNS